MERVEAALNGSAQNLPEIGENRYQGKLNAPATKAKEVVYPVMITAYFRWNLPLPEKTEKSWDF